MKLSAEVVDTVTPALRGVEQDLQASIKPVARPLSDELYLITREQFRSHGSRGRSGAWPANKASTIAGYTAQNRRGFAVLNEPMRRTDALFVAATTRGAPHGVYEVEDDQLTVGVRLPYAAIHQKKRRKVYDLTESDERKLGNIVKGGLGRKFKDRGFNYVDRDEIPF